MNTARRETAYAAQNRAEWLTDKQYRRAMKKAKKKKKEGESR